MTRIYDEDDPEQRPDPNDGDAHPPLSPDDEEIPEYDDRDLDPEEVDENY